jgi:hypothetical protein
MKETNNIQKDETEETSPNLFSVKKENPFDVPANYFESLASEITDKCVVPEKHKSVRLMNNPLQKVLVPLAIAASVILIILISHRKTDNNIINTDQYAYNDNSSTSEYLDNLIDNDELDESLIISVMLNDDTIKSNMSDHASERLNASNENPVIFADTASNVTITEDDIIQYLLEEDESDDLLN